MDSVSREVTTRELRDRLSDTYAYALHRSTRSTGEPMLFKGNDFSAAGVKSAVD